MPSDEPDGEQPAVRQATRRGHLRTVVGVLLTVVLLGGILLIVPVDEVLAAVGRADPVVLLVALGPALVNIYLRGARWAMLFRPRHVVRGTEALGPALIGLGLNAVLPGRVGDLARVSIGSRRFGVSMSFVASTIVVERFLDMAILLALVAGATAALPDLAAGTTVTVLDQELSATAVTGAMKRVAWLSGALAVALVLALTPQFQRLVLRVVGWMPWVGARVRDWIEPRLAEVRSGLQVLREPGPLAAAAGMSVLMWVALAVGNVLVAEAIDGIALNLAQASVVTAIAIAASFLPSVPGAWGIYEAGALLGLAMVGASPEEAGIGVAFALISHLLTYLPVVVSGGVAGMRRSVDWRRPMGQRPQPPGQRRRATRMRDG